MNEEPDSNHLHELAALIDRTQAKLEELEREIEAIGEPAAHALRERLEALKVEEHALQRNFSEARAGKKSDEARMRKVEALLHHIEREESSMQHEADFLSLGAPSSVSVAFKGGARLYELGARGLKRILRDHQPWRSPFVNRTYETITHNFDTPARDKNP
jgi:chromosome segregation ATPase